MKVLVAPDKFKGTYSAYDIAKKISERLIEKFPGSSIIQLPIADGGEGTAQLIANVLGLHPVKAHTVDALQRPIEVEYFENTSTVALDVSASNGLWSIEPSLRQPLEMNSRGFGILLRHILSSKPKEILIGLGGSAFTDGGWGCMDAFSLSCKDKHGLTLEARPKHLRFIENCQISGVNEVSKMVALCDVDNPIIGEMGTVRQFSGQKGANKDDQVILEEGIEQWVRVLEGISGKNLGSLPGGGASGGLGVALHTFFDAQLVNGFQYIAALLELEKHIREADLIVTGEGNFDQTSLQGKATGQIIDLCEKYKKEVWVVSGQCDLTDPLPLYDKLSHYFWDNDKETVLFP